MREGQSLHLPGDGSEQLVIGRVSVRGSAGILTGVGVSHFLPAAVRARVELLRERARDELMVTCGGVSMEPAIRRGDRVAIRDRAPRVGDVAAFVTRRGELELHRLIARAPLVGWWVHGGDNQTAPTLGLVHGAQVIGVADGFARGPGWRERGAAMQRIATAAWRVVRRRRRQP